MNPDRAIIAALKIFGISCVLSWIGIRIILPLVASEFLFHTVLGVITALLVGFLGVVVFVYFTLEEVERGRKELEGGVDTSRYDDRLRLVEEMTSEIIKALPEKVRTRIEDIKTRCSQCGNHVPSGFRACPYCGAQQTQTG